MSPAVLNLLLDYIDEVIRLNGHSHGAAPFAQAGETGFPKSEVEALKRGLRDAIYDTSPGPKSNVIIEGEFTRIGD